MLATDPHQPHALPNTFFYVHLNVGSWNAFGAAFPGVPYFMMGYTSEIAWGLTTGCVDCYDLFIEEMNANQYRTQSGWKSLETRVETIHVKGQSSQEITIQKTHHGVLLPNESVLVSTKCVYISWSFGLAANSYIRKRVWRVFI